MLENSFKWSKWQKKHLLFKFHDKNNPENYVYSTMGYNTKTDKFFILISEYTNKQFVPHDNINLTGKYKHVLKFFKLLKSFHDYNRILKAINGVK